MKRTSKSAAPSFATALLKHSRRIAPTAALIAVCATFVGAGCGDADLPPEAEGAPGLDRVEAEAEAHAPQVAAVPEALETAVIASLPENVRAQGYVVHFAPGPRDGGVERFDVTYSSISGKEREQAAVIYDHDTAEVFWCDGRACASVVSQEALASARRSPWEPFPANALVPDLISVTNTSLSSGLNALIDTPAECLVDCGSTSGGGTTSGGGWGLPDPTCMIKLYDASDYCGDGFCINLNPFEGGHYVASVQNAAIHGWDNRWSSYRTYESLFGALTKLNGFYIDVYNVKVWKDAYLSGKDRDYGNKDADNDFSNDHWCWLCGTVNNQVSSVQIKVSAPKSDSYVR
jgi:hypothetical protein